MDIEGIVSRLIAAGADLSTRMAVKKVLRGIVEDDDALDMIYIAVKNRAYRERFSKVPVKKRALFLPACLRNSKTCRAELRSDAGYVCKRCGACVIKEIIEGAESLGYRHVYIVPGGSMVIRIIKRGVESHNILAAVGVACVPELVEAAEKLSLIGIPIQAVPLLKAGCVDTAVDKDEVLHILRLGLGGGR